jgi:hypothetical protein
MAYERELDPYELDPSVSTQEFDQAQLAPSTEFPLVDEQDEADDEQRIATLVAITPATPHEAILHARILRQEHTELGVGRCLQIVRQRLFVLPSLWPNANVAIAHGAPVHTVTDFSKVPRGSVLGFVNDHLGHTSLGLGGALTSTPDYHVLGQMGVASIANVAQWCRATKVVWFETLNGFDVWPDPQKPEPPEPPKTPDWWKAEQRIRHLMNEAEAERKAHHPKVANQLEHWAAKIRARTHGPKKG